MFVPPPTASSTVDDRGGHGADDASTAPGTASPTSSASVDDRRGSGSDDVTAARRLSPREREVLVLVSRGMANKQIAPALGIAERTVKLHLNAVFRQLNVVDHTTAALWARENLGSW